MLGMYGLLVPYEYFSVFQKHALRETKAGAPIQRISPGSCRVESSSFTLDARRLSTWGWTMTHTSPAADSLLHSEFMEMLRRLS